MKGEDAAEIELVVEAIQRRLGALLPNGPRVWVAPSPVDPARRRAAWETNELPRVVVLVLGPKGRWVDVGQWLLDCGRWGVAEVYCWEPAVGALTVVSRGRESLEWTEGATSWVSVALGLRFVVEGGALVIGEGPAGQSTGGSPA
jgi:hypothetical protein